MQNIWMILLKISLNLSVFVELIALRAFKIVSSETQSEKAYANFSSSMKKSFSPDLSNLGGV